MVRPAEAVRAAIAGRSKKGRRRRPRPGRGEEGVFMREAGELEEGARGSVRHRLCLGAASVQRPVVESARSWSGLIVLDPDQLQFLILHLKVAGPVLSREHLAVLIHLRVRRPQKLRIDGLSQMASLILSSERPKHF